MAYNPTGDVADIDEGDNAWILISAALVLLMTPGVAFFYGGVVKTKHVVAIHLASMICIALVTIQWFLIGYTIAFEPSSDVWGHADWAALTKWSIGPTADATTISGFRGHNGGK